MDLSLYIESFGSNAKSQEYFLNKDKKLYCVASENESILKLTLVSNLNNLILHWGIGLKHSNEWISPLLKKEIFASLPDSKEFDGKAAQTMFKEINPSVSKLEIEIHKKSFPKQINFVIKRENTWFNNNGKNYAFSFVNNDNSNKSSPEISSLENDHNDNQTTQQYLNKIIQIETSNNSWTLMHRFNLCNEWLNRLNSNGDMSDLVWIFVWMRYSSLRKLVWQRQYNTKPSELSHSQKNLSLTLCRMISTAPKDSLISKYNILYLIMGSFGKGGDNGQRIRDQILEIMHRHHIPEKNDHFYEQWHQKLHNNTTPDDIGICEAVLAFNKTNDIGKYWEVLSRHGITKERLLSFERPIKEEPFYAPHLVWDFTQYLETLNSIHSGNNLAINVKNSENFVGDEVKKLLEELLANLNDFDKIKQMERALFIRNKIVNIMEGKKSDLAKFREIFYLDMSLEAYIRQISESIIHLEIPIAYLNKMIIILIENLLINCDNAELKHINNDWKNFTKLFKKTIEKNYEQALILKSCSDRLKRTLSQGSNQYYQLFNDKAIYLGKAFNIDERTIDSFSEEIIRGSIFFTISIALKKLDEFFKKINAFSSFTVISNFPNKVGFLEIRQSLQKEQEKYNEKTVLLVEKISGEEEIPLNVEAIISSSELDMLSHISIRARNSQTLLISCQDDKILSNIKQFNGKFVKIAIACEQIKIECTEYDEGGKNNAIDQQKPQIAIIKNEEIKTFVITPELFSKERTGSKSLNCAFLKQNLPKSIGVPSSLAFPFGLCEYILNLPENIETKKNYEKTLKLLEEKGDCDHQSYLNSLRNLITNIILPEEFLRNIFQTLKKLGILDGSLEENNVFFNSLKKVWASKFSYRAFLSTLKAGIPYNSIVMSVLCQNIVPATYAFVLHTKNPTNGKSEEIYGELVLGLGETLVGSYEGRAFAFIANKTNDYYKILSFPNKSVRLFGQGIILRSDSNCEDLEGFAGAGLFDSIVVNKTQEFSIEYSKDRIFLDEQKRVEIIKKLKEIALETEKIYSGVAQDIEGVINESGYFVVQARPQI